MLINTSGLLCYIEADDARHTDAVKQFDAAPLRLTHNYVLAEIVALSQARRLPRATSLDFANNVTIDEEIEVVWVELALHTEAIRLLQSQLDKSYSLCDAVN
jgi:uncharacterized protein